VHKTDKTVQVELIAKWFSNGLPYFHYDVELPAKMLARSISREQWSGQLFESLRE